MKLSDKYTLGKLVSAGEVNTYAAQEVASQSAVLVHRLSSGAAQAELMRKVLRYLRAGPTGGSGEVLEMFEDEGVIHLVTRPIPGFKTLEDWLNARTADAGPRPRIESGPPVSPPSNTILGTGTAGLASSKDETAAAGLPGEFTQLFQSQPQREAVKPAPPSPGRPLSHPAAPARAEESAPTFAGVPSPTPRPTPSQAEEATGEFAALFRASQPPAERRGPGVPADKPRQPAGEFTQLLQSLPMAPPPAVDPVTRPAPPAPSKVEEAKPGEFTLLFRHPLEGPADAGSSPFILAQEAESQSGKPGELTQILQSAARPEPFDPSRPAEQPPDAPGNFTSIFGTSESRHESSAGWASDSSSTLILSSPTGEKPTAPASGVPTGEPSPPQPPAASPSPSWPIQGGPAARVPRTFEPPASIAASPPAPPAPLPQPSPAPPPPRPIVKPPVPAVVPPAVKPPAIPAPPAPKLPRVPGAAPSWLPVALIVGGLALAIVAVVLYLTMK